MQLLTEFLRRDFLTQISYRSAFVLSFVGIFFRAFTFFFISKLIEPAAGSLPAEVGDAYFPFVLLGIAFNSYFGTGLNAFARSIRQAQTTGTLEAMLVTPAPLPAIVLGSAAWSYLFTTLQVAVYLVLGLLLGVDFSQANWGLALLGLLVGLVSFAAIGIIAAGIIMIIKRGDPVTSLISSLSALLGGIYYPIELLPSWLQPVSALLPVTYALRIMRRTLLEGARLNVIASDLLILIGFCIVLLPLALWLFRLAVNRARAEGSLGQF